MSHLAIITGASGGIGRAMARRLASEGIAIAAVARTLDGGDFDRSLAETVRQIEADGGVAKPFVADLGRPDLDRAALVAEVEEAFGDRVDILINNAAAARRYDTSFEDMPRDWFFDSIETNVWNTWALMQAVIPGMKAKGAGWVVNLSSRLAGPRIGPPFEPHPLGGAVLYGTTKAAIDRITTGAAMELWNDNIAVNTLAPNRGVATAHAAKAVPGWPSEPEETMAEAALLLTTSDPREVTGRVGFSLALIKEFERPVRTLDGKGLVEGWQPADIDPASILPDHLVFNPAPPVPQELLGQGA